MCASGGAQVKRGYQLGRPASDTIKLKFRQSWPRIFKVHGPPSLLLHQLLDSRSDLFAQTLAPGNHQNGVIAGDRPNDLRPSRMIQRLGYRSG